MARMHKQPKPRESCLDLCARAAEMLKAAGFVIHYVSMRTESVYYSLPGRHGLLRVSAHRSKTMKHVVVGTEPIVATLTFCGHKADRAFLVMDDLGLCNKVWTAVGQFIMRSVEPRYKGRGGKETANQESLQ